MRSLSRGTAGCARSTSSSSTRRSMRVCSVRPSNRPRGWLASDGLIYAESDAPLGADAAAACGLQVVRAGRAGQRALPPAPEGIIAAAAGPAGQENNDGDCGLPRDVRSADARTRGPRAACRRTVLEARGRRRRQPHQAAVLHAGRAHRDRARSAVALSERRSVRLPRPAEGFRPRPERAGDRARPARGVRLRVRVPDGGDEPLPAARCRDDVPHAVRPVPVHLRHDRARDRAARRRRQQVRLPVRREVAAGQARADGIERARAPSSVRGARCLPRSSNDQSHRP